jgi:phage repressor protein C with HTH and peptisase S24 domain
MYSDLSVKDFIEKYHLTQKEVGNHLGVNRKTVAKYSQDNKIPDNKRALWESLVESVLTGESPKTDITNDDGRYDVLDFYGNNAEPASQNAQLPIEKVNHSPSKLTNYKPSKFEDLVPFWEIDFIAGNSFDSIDNQTSKPTYYMDIPDFRGCTAFRAYSDSMEGLIKSGSILFGTKVERWHEHLEYGQVYGIVCDDGRKYLKYIKRYRENPREYFLLESENKAYDEFEMPKSAIRSIWLIHGHLSKRI